MKITFMGAGSTVFAKNVLGDVLLTESLRECEIALYDIDGQRLEDSYLLITMLNEKLAGGVAKVNNILALSRERMPSAARISLSTQFRSVSTIPAL